MNLTELVEELSQAKPRNEAELSQVLFDALTRYFQSQGLDINVRKEEYSLSGRVDARIGKVFFELKTPGELKGINGTKIYGQATL